MVNRNCDPGNGHNIRVALRWLRAEAILLLGVLPSVGMVLECQSLWKLTAEWVALYGVIATMALVTLGLAVWKTK